MTVVHATAFGAIAGDGKDDTTAVLAALEQCGKASLATLAFQKGSYDLCACSNPKDGNILFAINNLNQLTIDGNGSEFQIHWARVPEEHQNVLATANALAAYLNPVYVSGQTAVGSVPGVSAVGWGKQTSCRRPRAADRRPIAL